MKKIQVGDLPDESLLQPYRKSGAFTDCYFVDVPRAVSQAEYIEAFYTARLFKTERLVLSLLARRPSTDAEARQLATAQTEQFAIWRVEGRTPNQLLLCDFLGRTRSWLMAYRSEEGETRLYFGSAVVPKARRSDGQPSFGFWFHALSSFHSLYSRSLLRAAMSRLLRQFHPR